MAYYWWHTIGGILLVAYYLVAWKSCNVLYLLYVVASRKLILNIPSITIKSVIDICCENSFIGFMRILK